MTAAPPFKLFIIYAREDQPALLELKAHLRPLEKRGDLKVWYDGEILPGQDWSKAIKEELETADIVLLFISKYFFNSEYIEREELKKALERHEKGEAVVIPVIVKTCYWEAYREISALQVLPKDGKPVYNWENIDEAWVYITKALEQITNNLIRKRVEDQLAEEGISEIKNAISAYDRGDYEVAKTLFQKHIQNQESIPSDAANYLGVMYEKGQGFNQDYYMAVKWYTKSAEQGSEVAQNNLATIYEKGYLGDPDYTQAVRWYKRSAEQGYHWAQNNLGYLYLLGRGVKKDEIEAFQWFKRSAQKGNAMGMTNLGFLLMGTDEIAQDFVEARKYFLSAANLNNKEAQFNLGVIFENGLGVKIDLSQAFEWYSKSANQGDELAKEALKRLNYSE